jgi:hypothetical protein
MRAPEGLAPARPLHSCALPGQAGAASTSQSEPRPSAARRPSISSRLLSACMPSGAPLSGVANAAPASGRSAEEAVHDAARARRRMRTTGIFPATDAGLPARLLRQAAASASRLKISAASLPRSSMVTRILYHCIVRTHKTGGSALRTSTKPTSKLRLATRRSDLRWHDAAAQQRAGQRYRPEAAPGHQQDRSTGRPTDIWDEPMAAEFIRQREIRCRSRHLVGRRQAGCSAGVSDLYAMLADCAPVAGATFLGRHFDYSSRSCSRSNQPPQRREA